MKKLCFFAIPGLALFCLLAMGCLRTVAPTSNNLEATTEATNMESQKQQRRPLVVYYSFSRNTEAVAKRIAARTDADLYEVRTKKAYPDNPYATSAISVGERATGKLPELIGDFPDLARYDIIFVGSPIWNANMATPMDNYLKQTDFTGKTVVPFSTSMGSGQSGFLNDFRENLKNAAVVGEYLDIEFPGNGRPEAFSEEELDAMLKDWLLRVGAYA